MFGESRPGSVCSVHGGRSRLCLLATLCGILFLGTALGGCGGSGKASGTPAKEVTATRTSALAGNEVKQGTVTATGAGISATLRATTHTPKVNAPWPISFTVTQAGKPAKAKLSYEYMLAGAVVAKRSHYSFTGHFKDVFRWPASSVGYPLTFRAVLHLAGKTVHLDYPVKVAR